MTIDIANLLKGKSADEVVRLVAEILEFIVGLVGPATSGVAATVFAVIKGALHVLAGYQNKTVTAAQAEADLKKLLDAALSKDQHIDAAIKALRKKYGIDP